MELLRRTKEGDMEAREQLIAGNLRLVLSVIQKFSNRGENLDDLFQVGCIGLIKAIDNFNTDLDVRFSTYGVPMIIGEIRRYLRDNSSVRVSRSMRDTAYRVLQALSLIHIWISHAGVVETYNIPGGSLFRAALLRMPRRLSAAGGPGPCPRRRYGYSPGSGREVGRGAAG